MKFDLTTSIIVGIVGVVAAFFVMNLFIPEIESFSFKTLSTTPSTTLTDPNPEVFNFRAINPTVEVYVGQSNPDGTTTDTEANTDANADTDATEENNTSSAPAEGE